MHLYNLVWYHILVTRQGGRSGFDEINLRHGGFGFTLTHTKPAPLPSLCPTLQLNQLLLNILNNFLVELSSEWMVSMVWFTLTGLGLGLSLPLARIPTQMDWNSICLNICLGECEGLNHNKIFSLYHSSPRSSNDELLKLKII